VVVLAQALVAGVHVVVFDGRLGLQLLDEVAMPVQPAHESFEPLALAARQARVVQAGAGGLHHLAQAQAAPGEIRREARACAGRRERRGDATTVARAALVQKTLQHLKASRSPTALSLGWFVCVEVQFVCARPGVGEARQLGHLQRWRRHLLGVRELLPLPHPVFSFAQATHHAELAELTPRHGAFSTPPFDAAVALVARGIAGFFVR